MIEHASWLLPAAKELYKNREELEGLWQSLLNFLRGQRQTIAFTGMGGAGKTVLHDHLSGDAFSATYRLPGASADAESGKIRSPELRLISTVIPGQPGSPRRADALTDAFDTEPVIDGVIHVVCNGFNTYSPSAESELVAGGTDTLDKFLHAQRREEIEALDELCDRMRSSIRRSGKPRWMLLAVAKCDLYYDRMDLVKDHYLLNKASPFVAKIVELQNMVGSDNFSWTAQPVSSWLQDFNWNGASVPTQFDLGQRNHYLAVFAEVLQKVCRIHLDAD